MRKLGDIHPYEKNPKKNEKAVEYVAKSIKEFGFLVPLVLDKNDVIAAGDTRYKAAKKLKLKEVPTISADNLTDEQVTAFRLADNKVAEQAEWDYSLLADELDEILDINMQDFGFPDMEPPEEKEPDYYDAERERTFDAYNLHDVDEERLTKKWQMPIIKKCTYIPKDLISFNYAKTSKEYEKGVHFYVDDYQFERIWNAPHDYVDILRQFDCILTPDFSLYTEMPLPMQIWNVYRSKMVGQIMQDYGLTVIPTLQWCREDSFEFAFDGIEPGGVVSVSTIGVKQQPNAKKIWTAGMDEAMRQLKPKAVVVYGGDIGYDFGKAKVIFISNHNTERIGRGKT
jgi:hypothetical protein